MGVVRGTYYTDKERPVYRIESYGEVHLQSIPPSGDNFRRGRYMALYPIRSLWLFLKRVRCCYKSALEDGSNLSYASYRLTFFTPRGFEGVFDF